MNEFYMKAFAKINLGLDVISKLPNGYHEVKMIMQSLAICDELFFTKIPAGITMTCDDAELPTDENNLVYRAASLMFDEYHIPGGVSIHLKKNIPIAAGMAGGSTDAAAVMKGINEFFQLNIPLQELMELGVRIGADVPYCIMGGTTLAEGIGEKLTPLPPMPKCLVLVVKPDINVSTKFVYEHLDAEGVAHHPDIDGMIDAIHAGSLQGIMDKMGNVLETVTIPAHPVIDTIKDKMTELGALKTLMSGSGPTVFGFFTKENDAAKAFTHLKADELAKQVFLTIPV